MLHTLADRTCDATGRVEQGDEIDCKWCEGEGKIAHGQHGWATEPCEDCGGTGKVLPDDYHGEG